MHRTGGNGADAQPAQFAAPSALYGVQCPCVLLEQRARMDQQHLACGGELNPTRLASEQLHVQPLLQRTNAQAQWGLLSV